MSASVYECRKSVAADSCPIAFGSCRRDADAKDHKETCGSDQCFRPRDGVEKRIRETFDHVNNHRWKEAVKAVAPRIHHRVSGDHALGGERHNKEDLRRWFERLGRVLPDLQIKVNNVLVSGWPWHTTVFAQWDGTATLLNGDASYINRGLHVFTLRWGRVHSLEEFQDSQAAASALAAQAAAGLEEATAEQILS